MAKKKAAKKGRPKKAGDPNVELEVGKNVKLTLDIAGFIRDVDKAIRNIDASKVKIADGTGCPVYSLTQCAEIIGVNGPALNYYVKQDIVKSHGKPGEREKKYFGYGAVLTFWIITQLRETLGINVELCKGLQAQFRKAGMPE